MTKWEPNYRRPDEFRQFKHLTNQPINELTAFNWDKILEAMLYYYCYA